MSDGPTAGLQGAEAFYKSLQSDAAVRTKQIFGGMAATGRAEEILFDKRSFFAPPAQPSSLAPAQGPPTQQQGVTPISLTVGLPDPASIPRAQLMECMAAAAFEAPLAAADVSVSHDQVWGYAGSSGYRPLRRALADHFSRRRGHAVGPEEVLLDNGSSGAIRRVAEAFLSAGDAVLAERPAYTTIFPSLEALGARVVGVDLDPDGIRLDLLEKTFRRLVARGTKPKMLYLQTTFSNPRGSCYSTARMEALLTLCERLGLLIVNDEAYYGLDLDHGPRSYDYLSEVAAKRHLSYLVVTVGTFSKTIAPGLRVGWVLGTETLIQRVDLLKFDGGISSVLLGCLALFVSRGYWDLQIDSAQVMYRRKLDVFVTSLKKFCGRWMRWQVPRGGFYLFVELVGGLQTEELSRHLAARGLVARGGAMYYFSCDVDGNLNPDGVPGKDGILSGYKRRMRLCFSQLSLGELKEAARRLGQACECAASSAVACVHSQQPARSASASKL